jgi:hypothetical protein
MKKKLLLLAVLGCLFCNQGNAQSPGTESPALNPNPELISIAPKKGAFFITPFYQFSHFEELTLTANTNHYNGAEGVGSYDFTDEDLAEYNDNYGTDYINSLAGLKIGYQMLNGLGVSAYVGANHYQLNSFVSPQNTQSYTTDYPAITIGISADYYKKLTENFVAMALASANFSKTGSGIIQNTNGSDIISSSMKSMYWELNIGVAYHLGKFYPYAGAGYTQQFLNPVTDEQILIGNENGIDTFDKIQFDSRFKGSSLYGFAGAEYSLNKKLSVYANGSFINPFRATFGLRIVI